MAATVGGAACRGRADSTPWWLACGLLAVGAVAVVVMAAPSADAAFAPVYGPATVGGDLFAGGVGLRANGMGNIVVPGVSGPAMKAWMYWVEMGTLSATAPGSATINGNTISGTPLGSGPNLCWGGGISVAYRADVTGFISGPGPYAVTIPSGSTMAEGASLYVIAAASGPPHEVVVVDGYAGLNTVGATATIDLPRAAGLNPDTSKLVMAGADGQTYPDHALWNGALISGYQMDGSDPETTPSGFGALWDTDILTGMSSVIPNNQLKIVVDNDCLGPTAYGLSTPVPGIKAEFKWLFETTDSSFAPGYAGPYDLTLDPVHFTDLTTFMDMPGSSRSWDWDFGDSFGSAAQHPVHPYDDNGIYQVCLKASQTLPGGFSMTDTVCHDVKVNNRAPQAKILAPPDSHSTSYVFADYGKDLDGTIVQWRYDFGDGTYYFGRNPHHVFAPGDYNVCLTVVDDDGATTTVCMDIHIDVQTGPDTDLDGIADLSDDCPTVANHDQADEDLDGTGDACDPDYRPASPGGEPPPVNPFASAPDTDQDGIPDQADNCPGLPNHDQADLDGDGAGDACDADGDGDGVANVAADPAALLDNCPLANNPDQRDADGDGAGDACDLHGGPPGPSEVAAANRAAPPAGAAAAASGSGWDGLMADPGRAAMVLGLAVAIASGGAGLVAWSLRRWKGPSA